MLLREHTPDRTGIAIASSKILAARLTICNSGWMTSKADLNQGKAPMNIVHFPSSSHVLLLARQPIPVK